MGAPTTNPTSDQKAGQKAEKIRDQVLALDVKRVADWISTLVKTVKASRLYLPNNPQLQRFQSDLESRTWSCLKEIGDIPLAVQQFDFLFENYSVYHNADRNDSLAFRFYADGVRAITIKEGLEVDELRSLLEVLRRAIDGPNGQDDVVTLLWERDFRHVEYAYISVDDLTEADAGGGARENDEPYQPQGEGIPWPAAGADDEPDETHDENEGYDVGTVEVAGAGAEEPAGHEDPAMAAERSDDWSAHIQRSRSWERPDGVQFQLSEKERDDLEHQIRMEEVRPLQSEVLDIVAAILRHEENGAGFMDSAIAFQRFIELAIEEGNVSRARELLARLKGIAADRASEGPEFEGIVEKVIREIGRPSFLGQLAPTLNSHAELEPEALTDFLVQLGSGATPAICDLLGQVNHVRHRRALCEALIQACKHDVEPLLARLGDSRWYVIRNVVYVLGRIAHQGVERALDRALHHEDVRVRKEAVRALGNLESPTARAYLVSAFRDADAGVRIQAAMTLAEKRDDRAAQNILGAIQTPDFAKRDLRERQAFYEALGRSGSDAIVLKVEPLLTRGGLFKRGDDDERYHAALALAWLGTSRAIAVLDREMKSRRDPVRAAVERALETVRKAALSGKNDAVVEAGPGGPADVVPDSLDMVPAAVPADGPVSGPDAPAPVETPLEPFVVPDVVVEAGDDLPVHTAEPTLDLIDVPVREDEPETKSAIATEPVAVVAEGTRIDEPVANQATVPTPEFVDHFGQATAWDELEAETRPTAPRGKGKKR